MTYTYTAPEANSLLAEYLDNLGTSTGGMWGSRIPSLKDAPDLLNGQVMVFHGCAGEGKTAVKSWWLSQQNKRLLASGDPGVVLSVMLEESMEIDRSRTMLSPFNISDVMSGKMTRDAALSSLAESALDRMMYIGASMNGELIHPDAANFNGLTPAQLAEAVYNLKVQRNIEVKAMALDYVQLMQDNDNSRDQVQRVANASKQLERASKATFRCPFVVVAQSDLKKVKASMDKQPKKEDIQWSSQIAQDASAVWSFWKPSSDYPALGTMSYGSKVIPTFKDIIVCQVNKWRGAMHMDGRRFILTFGKPFGNIYEIDVEFLVRAARNLDRIRAAGIEYAYDVTEEYL